MHLRNRLAKVHSTLYTHVHSHTRKVETVYLRNRLAKVHSTLYTHYTCAFSYTQSRDSVFKEQTCRSTQYSKYCTIYIHVYFDKQYWYSSLSCVLLWPDVVDLCSWIPAQFSFRCTQASHAGLIISPKSIYHFCYFIFFLLLNCVSFSASYC